MTTAIPGLFSNARHPLESDARPHPSRAADVGESPWPEDQTSKDDAPQVVSWLTPVEVVSSAPDLERAYPTSDREPGGALPSSPSPSASASHHDLDAAVVRGAYLVTDERWGDQPWLVTFWYAVWGFVVTLGLAMLFFAVVLMP